jgi:hypothetical protein
MRMLNYSSSFSYPHDNHFKEEVILLYPHHYLNLSSTLNYLQLEVRGQTCSFVCEPFSDTEYLLQQEFYKFL